MRFLSWIWPKRWWQWGLLTVAALLLAVSILLPRFLREAIETQLAQATTASVHVADVDLNLFRQSLTIRGIALTLLEEERPAIAVERVRGTLQLSALLLRREVIIEEIRLDNVQIAAVLQSDGQCNLARLLPPPPPEPVPETDLPTLTVDRVRLREGRISLRDLTRTPEAYASLSLHEVTTGTINIQRQGLAAPVRIHLKGELSGKDLFVGSFASEGQAFWNRSETRVEATVNVQRFALAFVEPYLRAVFTACSRVEWRGDSCGPLVRRPFIKPVRTSRREWSGCG